MTFFLWKQFSRQIFCNLAAAVMELPTLSGSPVLLNFMRKWGIQIYAAMLVCGCGEHPLYARPQTGKDFPKEPCRLPPI